MSGRRSERVAEAIRAYVTQALIRDLGDPVLSGIVVTTIEVSDDLSIAHVKVRLLVGDDDTKQRREAMRRLHRASTRLRRGLAPSLNLRRVPELRFDYDVGLDASRRVEELLREIDREPKGMPGSDVEAPPPPEPDDGAEAPDSER